MPVTKEGRGKEGTESDPIPIDLVVGNGDAASLILGFGHDDSDDAVLEACGDALVEDVGGEFEASYKVAYTALSEPVFSIFGGLLLLGCSLRNRSLFGRCRCIFDRHKVFCFCGGCCGSGFERHGIDFILNTSLVRVLCLLFLARFSSSIVLRLSAGSWRGRRRRRRSVVALKLATNDNRLRIRKLNVHILLVHAGQFAIELIGISRFADIKLGLPLGVCRAAKLLSLGLDDLLMMATSGVGIGVVVVDDVEEGSEGSLGVGLVADVALEEGHFMGFWWW